MSWMKRAQGAPPAPPAAEQQPYTAAQQYNNQQNVYQNYPGPASGNPNTQQQQYWQIPGTPQYAQQYGQIYQQSDYTANNANQLYQQYNQNYPNQVYSTTQANYQQSYYQNQPPQQLGYPQNKQNKDAWEDNWDWGWDESKQAQNASQQAATTAQPVISQQSAYNNANVIEESFTATDTWNWSLEEKNESKNQPIAPLPPGCDKEPVNLPIENSVVNETLNQLSTSEQSAQLPLNEEPNIRTLNDRDVVKERMPNLALGKRFHLDNLTPQWSIESQMSQESSDGPHTLSESTYRSENQSRNSSKSSPGLNTENSNFNYSQSGLDEMSPQNTEWSRHSADEPTLVDSLPQNDTNIPEVTDEELANTLQEMNISNQENHTPKSIKEKEPSNDLESVPLHVPPQLASTSTCQPYSPAPSPANHSLPPTNLPPPPQNYPTSSSPANLPPQTNFPSTSSQNPFKHSGPLSHKPTSKTSNSNFTTVSQHMFTHLTPKDSPNQMSNTGCSSPVIATKVSHQHGRAVIGYPTANMETMPDNSERPDHPQVPPFRLSPVAQQIPENLEVAPRNDRNEYLQTAHLSSSDYGDNTNFGRNLPPPGLRRMVVGQQESEYDQTLNLSSDEPPPGLARMVPGQQTEGDNTYSQSGDNYMERHIDGQPTDISGRNPFRQADGQQTPDNYTNTTATRTDRRPIGLDRMVPGEPSNDEYTRSQQYQGSNYSANEQRVVTGVDHDYVPISSDMLHSDVREQNMDGSDYSEQTTRVQPRNILGIREMSSDASGDYGPHASLVPPEIEHQREVTMEGENLQDLSIISSTELSFSRDQIFDGANVTMADNSAAKTDLSDSLELPASGSRRQSLNRLNTSGEESERDRAFKASPRRDRDKHKSSRDRDRDKDRYSREERKYDRDPDRRSGRDRDDRRSEKESRKGERDRRDREVSPDNRRHRRSVRSHRYETEDTDYYSDRERERRGYREGSYTSSKPPRPDDKDRRYRDDRDKSRRYATIERERRYELDERDGASRSRRDDRRYDRRYRDIDPTRKYGNLRREEEERRRAGDLYSSPSRPESGGLERTEDELDDTLGSADRRRRSDRSRRTRHDPHYDGYGDPYTMQRQHQTYQYQYYERLRLTDPVAYMEVYNKIMAGQPLPPPPPGALDPLRPVSLGSRGSVHSGRSSANGHKDVDFNTDASLNLHLEESTVRSERMTPYKYSTAHVKGVISSRHVVVVRPSYPVDGLPATVDILDLSSARARDPDYLELAEYPGPLTAGVTHKQTVLEYCARQITWAASRAPHDALGYALVWELLALLLRQNGVVVGADVADLLMRSERETSRPAGDSPPPGSPHRSPRDTPADERPESTPAALDKYREYLTVGDGQRALEWAMTNGLWGHALQLSSSCDRRTRTTVAARFLASVPARDPLHTLYTARAARTPPAALTAGEGGARGACGEWRAHLAIVLANPSGRPDCDRRTVVQMGDSLSSRGLFYSAQFCYVAAEHEFGAHPLAPLSGPAPAGPPRLSLLLAPAHAPDLRRHAPNRAIFATEIYEYARSLRGECVIEPFQVYKLVLASRLVDAGLYGRALGYLEPLGRRMATHPDLYCRRLVTQVAALAERLKCHDPTLQDDPPLMEESGDSGETSPRHRQWIEHLHAAAAATAPLGPPPGPATPMAPAAPMALAAPMAPATPPMQPQQYSWTPEQSPQRYLQPIQPAVQPEDPDASHPYPDPPEPTYWHGDTSYGYEPTRSETSSAQVGEHEPRHQITMPGSASNTRPALYADYEDDPPGAPRTDEAPSAPKTPAEDGGRPKAGGGWLGGILTKLSLRPPNQMILPDDKNPSIVWDPVNMRWVNRDGEGESGTGPVPAPAPPPPPLEGGRVLTLGDTSSPALTPPVANIFKMQKGRHIKKSYVDVFNPSGASPRRPLPPATEVFGPAPPPSSPATDYFVPAPDDSYRTGI